MIVFPFGSGSSGNSYLVSHQNTHILLDAGISARRITQGLAQVHLTPSDLSGIFITHAHIDHISGLEVITRKCPIPLYASQDTLHQLVSKFPSLRPLCFALEQPITLSHLEITPCPTPHDCSGSLGFAVVGGSAKMSLFTDLGYVTNQIWRTVEGSHLIVAETNYDPELLKHGPYPSSLKKRVSSDHGHLSNQAGGELIANAVNAGVTTAILAHLSKENNTPTLALEAVKQSLDQANLQLPTLVVAGEKISPHSYTVETGKVATYA
ncbi:MAG: MBL fold metallo-hydrolase [Eubacteriales bacterium]